MFQSDSSGAANAVCAVWTLRGTTCGTDWEGNRLRWSVLASCRGGPSGMAKALTGGADCTVRCNRHKHYSSWNDTTEDPK
eukprot:2237081-Amphidinium_carterae.1